MQVHADALTQECHGKIILTAAACALDLRNAHQENISTGRHAPVIVNQNVAKRDISNQQ